MSPVSNSEYSTDKEYSDNDVCSEDEPVNNFECDDREQALLQFPVKKEILLSMSSVVS